MREARVAGAVAFAAAVALGLAASPAAALPEFLAGFDLEQDTTGARTEPGFQSVTECTFAPGESSSCPAAITRFGPSVGIGAGYLGGTDPSHRPNTGFDQDLGPPGVPNEDLWSDGHSDGLLGTVSPTLRIYGLAEGDYVLMLLSHRLQVVGAKTAFLVNGAPVGEIESLSDPTDLLAEQSLSVPVHVGPDGFVDVTFMPAGPIYTGHLNGVLVLVPEPSAGLLLAAGLIALAARRAGPGRGGRPRT